MKHLKRLLLPLLALLLLAPAAQAANPTNPLVGHELGHETATDAGNAVYNSWRASSGDTHTLYGRSALQPRARWYGKWSGTGATLTGKIKRYVANLQAGDPDKVAPITFFRIWPNGEGDRRPLTAAQQTDYKRWYDAAAAGIGDSRVAVILEPDLPLVLPRHNTPDTDTRLSLVRYAAQKLGALPHASVYIDAGSADWMPEDKDRSVVLSMLKRAGVQYVRGFALGATHYDAASTNVVYARSVAIALHRSGYKLKKAVIDTADNGRPFTHAQYTAMQRSGTRTNHYDNADVCVNLTQIRCVTLGIPPTSDVAAPAWGFSPSVDRYATDYTDGFLWFGRPWLKMQADPYCAIRAIQIGRTTPYQSPPMRQLRPATVRNQQLKCFRAP